ncbi:MAG TPA: Ig-like domain-containing protein [Methylomirabilota bacterium]|nr:Ig-like domain-containing protein [Methylomirabilota bacterium]
MQIYRRFGLTSPIRLLLFALTILVMTKARAQQGTPCLEPFCIEFHEGEDLEGFTGYLPCQFPNPGVSLNIASPGASGAANDFYLHARDLSGASIIQNFARFRGDWSCIAAAGCSTFCFDFRLFVDGSNASTLNITPSFILLSDPDGPCGPQPPVRAQFIANFTVTENGGTNAGWHKICAPITFLQGGNMPANSFGSWHMLDGAPATAWNSMLTNITGVQFPIDFTSNPAEEVGYDNICITEEECPQECVTIGKETFNCLPNGSYSYSFSLTNNTAENIKYLVLMDLPVGAIVTPGPLVTLGSPLPPGAVTNLTLTFSNIVSTQLCFRISFHDEKFRECCTIEKCLEVPECCGLITDECIKCDPEKPGFYTWTFTYSNLSADPITQLHLVPDTNCYWIAPITLNPPLMPGQSTNVTATIQELVPGCSPNFCILVMAHDRQWRECCAFIHCVTLPVCCNGATYTFNADFAQGALMNVTYNTVAHQLQFAPRTAPFPFVNIAASQRGTMVRIDVNTGAILGEYRTAPDGMSKDPSRTTVDRYGNVWVSNRAESSGGMGSVTRVALILGGTRVDAAGNADPNGLYLKPPFTYNSGAVDRDGDGLIKTSRGLGDILSWLNTGSVDSLGGVSTADDELIINYTRVNGTGTRAVAIDANNDVWVGGNGNRAHEKLDGFTGLPIPGTQFNFNWGGYGALVDRNGNLWSAGDLMRLVPNPTPPPAGLGTHINPVTGGSYGLGIDQCTGNIWVSNGWTNNAYHLFELDPSGNVVSVYQQPWMAQGVAVDANGHVWVAQVFGTQVWHLAPNPGFPHNIVGIVNGFQGVTGLAVDTNGKIWAAESWGNRASRIDPTLAAGLGAIDLSVNLGAGAGPYNYSDMTGFIAVGATAATGFWDVVHDGGAPGIDWGTVSWTSLEPPGTGITVEVRAHDDVMQLPTVPWTPIKNGSTFCGTGIRGRYLEVRVTFSRRQCTDITPVLYDLTIDCCNNDPCSDDQGPNEPPKVQCPEPVQICKGQSSTVTLNALVQDANGNALQVVWWVNGSPMQTNNVPAGGPPTSAIVAFTYNFPPGNHTVSLTVFDGKEHTKCETKVVNEQQAPMIDCPPGISVTNFSGVIPDFTKTLAVFDPCASLEQIKIEQTPAAGTPVGFGTHTVRLRATSPSGLSSVCQTFYAVAPVVRLSAPANYTSIEPLSSIDLTAVLAAGVSADLVREVRFYSGTNVIGSAQKAPFTFRWNRVPEGAHRLTVEAVSREGLTSVSPAVNLFSQRTNAPASAPVQLLNPTIQNEVFVFKVQTAPTQQHDVEYVDPALSAEWRLLRSIPGDGTVHTITEPLNNSTRFYRVRTR